MPHYDYLIVGAGLSGATFANMATSVGKKCLVIDRRRHIAGNCYTEKTEGIDVHVYGPHLFHTNNEKVWRFVTAFSQFNNYRHAVVADTAYGIVPMPINMHTFTTLMPGISSPEQARLYLRQEIVSDADDTSLEGWCLKNIGPKLYETLIRNYTMKQWNTDPKELPASIIKRLPVRFTYNNNYFTDTYQGVPIGGYTQLVERMLYGIETMTNVDYHTNRVALHALADNVVYTGPIDELYDYNLGKLPYRSVTFQSNAFDTTDAMGIGQINNARADGDFTRRIEHKHFNWVDTPRTIVSWEYPSSTGEPYYPINTKENNELALHYVERAKTDGYILCGRMARYQYLDMHQAIANAMHVAEEELHVQFA